MKHFQFSGLLQNDGWQDGLTVSVDSKGIITDIHSGKEDGAEVVNGYAIPGFQNAHSHAFQYAMAGLAEKHKSGAEADDFWNWREAMYQLALTMKPEDLETVATMLYSEMVRHGYTHVAEFHYLHHDIEGKPYNNIAEHGERLIAAAKKAGIKITLVPMFYQKGGFGMEPQVKQRRFISKSEADYLNLLEASRQATTHYDGASLGYGIHSLRAVEPSLIKSFLADNKMAIPFHIHISEQLKEIQDCLSFLGKRPVEWLLDNAEVSENYHLVHATHLVDSEVVGIANANAHVVLCPSTEGNLGDGIFPLRQFQKLGGRWSIGTDSHIGLNPLEELRILDYGQRLTSHQRNTFVDHKVNDSGEYAIKQSQLAGRAAMGNQRQAYFEVGQPLDAVVYDAKKPLLATACSSNRLSTIVYASDSSWVKGTIVNGDWVVKDHNHLKADEIAADFAKTMNALGVR
ncbi:formimidoylglutamate deiminase [Fulvivirga lutimaris]|uniref:formimidoylglutamate deiminase n=1 Tax=Fulvivirga lutimaris TaxID=1819566 RepID=UPI0012BC91C3|nr:formimidoylglutamate deiminase [Fulvivirga lutimaris]MTI39677.1 formimidoylglutamate deiminase [Fulvivirga lutimaris]